MIYRITFYDYWHSGAIKEAGKDADLKMQKDKEDNTPFYAAKSLNGLLRENMSLIDRSTASECLGAEGIGGDGKVRIDDAKLPEAVIGEIVKFGLQSQLYDKISSTAIGEEGTAKDKSLRNTEMTIPMTIEGEIELNGCDASQVSKAMKMIKQLGYKRNRGFGRCDVVLLGNNGKEIACQQNT